MNKFLIIFAAFHFVACASTEEAPLRDTSKGGTTPPSAVSQFMGHDLKQSAKFARLSKTIRFEGSGTALTPDARAALNDIANEMNRAEKSYQLVRISGFTDSMGSALRRQEISLQRAEAVRVYLVSRGVAPEKLEAVGMGSLYANNSGKLSKSEIMENRRVELEIVE